MRFFIFFFILMFSTTALASNGKTHPKKIKPVNINTIWVGKNDTSIACEDEKGVSLNVMEKELKSTGVKVIARQKVYDDKMRIQMCGIDKGVMNGYLIDKKDVVAAQTKGFAVLDPQPKDYKKK